jgi:hypothetical protein
MDAAANFAKMIGYYMRSRRCGWVAGTPESGFAMQVMRVSCCIFAAESANLSKRLDRKLCITGSEPVIGSSLDPTRPTRNDVGFVLQAS